MDYFLRRYHSLKIHFHYLCHHIQEHSRAMRNVDKDNLSPIFCYILIWNYSLYWWSIIHSCNLVTSPDMAIYRNIFKQSLHKQKPTYIPFLWIYFLIPSSGSMLKTTRKPLAKSPSPEDSVEDLIELYFYILLFWEDWDVDVWISIDTPSKLPRISSAGNSTAQ